MDKSNTAVDPWTERLNDLEKPVKALEFRAIPIGPSPSKVVLGDTGYTDTFRRLVANREKAVLHQSQTHQPTEVEERPWDFCKERPTGLSRSVKMNLMEWLIDFVSVLNIPHWGVSLNGTKKGPVTHGAMGVKFPDTLWFEATFAVDGVIHTVAAERALQGGVSKVTHNGGAVKGELKLSKHIVGFPPHLDVELDVNLDGPPAQRFRFDGVVD